MPSKTFVQVWSECKHLTRIECRAYMINKRRMPEELAQCEPETALLLYLADIFKFERLGDSNVILTVLTHFSDQIEAAARYVVERTAANRDVARVIRVGVFDGRYVTFSQYDKALDLETGEEVAFPRDDIKCVLYNVGNLMARRWGGDSPRLHNPEVEPDGTDADTEPPAAS